MPEGKGAWGGQPGWFLTSLRRSVIFPHMTPPAPRLKSSRLSWSLAGVFLLASYAAWGQRFLEISAEIQLVGYRGEDTNGPANAKPRTLSVVCLTSTNQWRIEDDWVQNSATTSFFDGTNVYRTSRIKSPLPEATRDLVAKTTRLAPVPFEVAKSNLTIDVWPSREGHPLGTVGANIAWLAFCSGPYLNARVDWCRCPWRIFTTRGIGLPIGTRR
jgi:hypothetical protein